MTRSRFRHALAWLSVALMATAIVVVGPPGASRNPVSAKQASAEQPAAETPAEAPVPEAKKKFRPRLPNYYGRVVDEEQRQKIYGVQKEYFPRIEALKAQLAALTAERDKKIEAVLTPEQRKDVEKLRAEAKQKRAKAAKETAAAKTSAG